MLRTGSATRQTIKWIHSNTCTYYFAVQIAAWHVQGLYYCILPVLGIIKFSVGHVSFPVEGSVSLLPFPVLCLLFDPPNSSPLHDNGSLLPCFPFFFVLLCSTPFLRLLPSWDLSIPPPCCPALFSFIPCGEEIYFEKVRRLQEYGIFHNGSLPVSFSKNLAVCILLHFLPPLRCPSG